MPLSFQSDLKKLGLSDKEAAVYLAALDTGPAPVQSIARKSKVARATTYLVLESLMKKGLVTRFEEGGKTTFVAESPQHLEQLLNQKEAELKRERSELKNLLPKLEAFVKVTDDRPVVRYYEGIEGIKVVRSELTRYARPGDTWYLLSQVDFMQAALGSKDLTYAHERKAKRIRSKAIFTTESDEVKHQLLETSDKMVERRFVSPEDYTSSSTLTIFRAATVIATYQGRIGGVVVESESVATMMRELFELAWKKLE